MVFSVRSAPADASDRDSDPFSSRELAVMVERVRAVDEILELAVDIIVIGWRPDHENFALEHLFCDAAPVIGFIYAPFLLTAFTAAKAGKDLLAGKGDKFRFNPGVFTLVEDHLDELRSVAFLSHAP